MKRHHIGLAGLCLVVGAWAGAANAAGVIPDYVTAAVKDPGRDPAQIAEDPVNKPADVVSFMQAKPGEAIVDFMPADAYYTRILSKVAGKDGHVYAFVPFAGAINGETIRRLNPGKKLPVDPALAVENLIQYPNVLVLWQFMGLDGGAFGIPKQADVIWAGHYAQYHTKEATDLSDDHKGPDYLGLPTADWAGATKALFDGVKRGGYLVASAPVALKGVGFSLAETLGRVDPEAAKAELMKAGFVLDGESNALANPADDHTTPAAAMKGKADRFLLRFKKPENAPPDKRAQTEEYAKVLYGNTWISGLGKKMERRLFYHPDGSYEELGLIGSLLQEGYWFVDAQGNICILHQYPAPERGYMICSTKLPFKIGEKRTAKGRRGESTSTLIAGIHYFGDGAAP